MPNASQSQRETGKAARKAETLELKGSIDSASRSEAAPPAHGAGAGVAPRSSSPPRWAFPPRLFPDDESKTAERAAQQPSRGDPATVSASVLGPVGKRRSPLLVALLSACSLGVYALAWHARVNTEMGNFDTRMHVRPRRSTFAVAVPWIVGVLISIAGAARIVLDQLSIRLPFDPHFSVTQGYFLLGGILAIPYLELVLVLSAVALALTVERVRVIEDRVGMTTESQARPARMIAWLVVPVIGGLAVPYALQRRLNTVWQRTRPALAARISEY